MLNNDKPNNDTLSSWILIISIILSIIAAQLLEGSLGLNYIVLSSLCIAIMIFLRKKFHRSISKKDYLLLSSVTIMSLFLIFRQSEVLYSLNLLAIILIIALILAQKQSASYFNIAINSWLLTPFYLLRLCWQTVNNLMTVGIENSLRLSGKQKTLHSVILGLIWALPFVLILGSLLVSSDIRFEKFTMDIFTFDFFKLFDNVFEVVLYFPLISAFFYANLQAASTPSEIPHKESTITMEGVQLLTILSSINLLFVTYILVQLSYFFGGEQLILESNNMTYASYARHGFWELITLSLLVLPLLLIAHWLQRQEQYSAQIWFKRLALFMVFCLMIIEASAIYRMVLYVTLYDLTELRFYSSIFMLYMMAGLVTFSLSVLKNKRGKFVLLMVIQALAFIVLLNIINPDARISQYNITHNQDKTIDTHYLLRLSSDAYPVIYQNRAVFTKKSLCLQLGKLTALRNKQKNHWYHWNWSSQQASQLIPQWQEQCQ